MSIAYVVRWMAPVARLASRFGVKLTRSWRYPQCDVNLLNIAVPALLVDRGADFFFLQVGASDGKTNDPLYPLVVRYGLRGLCVEPLPQSFQLLQETYRDRAGIILENLAISATDGPVTLTVADGAGMNIDLAQKSSLSGDCVRKHLPVGGRVNTIQVASMTIGSLCRKHGLKRLSLLQVDTEGFDFQVIRQTFDAGLMPDAIHYESLHLGRSEMEDCRALLREKGYELVESTVNTLAWKK